MSETKKVGQPHSTAGIQGFCLKTSCSPPLPFRGISQVALPQNAKSHDQGPTATGFSTPPLARLLLMLPQRCWRQGQGQDSQPDGDNSHRNHCSWLAILTDRLHGDTVLLEQHRRQGSPAVPTWERCLRPAGPPPADSQRDSTLGTPRFTFSAKFHVQIRKHQDPAHQEAKKRRRRG